MKTIDIEKYNTLPAKQKADIVLDFGIYLIGMKSGANLSALYSLSDFYVDVVYKRTKGAKLVSIKAYSSPDEVDKYLTRIDIGGLINEGIHLQ